MFRFLGRQFLIFGLVVVAAAFGQEAPSGRERPVSEDAVPAESAAFFEKKIRPVVVTECFRCHSSENGKKVCGGLALDTREGTRKGCESRAAIVPGSPSQSLLIKALGHSDPELSMPTKKKLDEAIVRDFEEWVRMGSPDPREAKQVAGWDLDLAKGREHWVFQPPKHVVTPEVKNSAWPRTDVDRFVLVALEAKGQTPVPDTDRRTLLHRLAFDPTGLPPSPAEMEAFAAEDSSESMESVVDRLLQSPRFGEKWARHWLDVARYPGMRTVFSRNRLLKRTSGCSETSWRTAGGDDVGDRLFFG